MNHAPHSDSPRTDFGAYLRSNREQRDLSLTDVARVTKIPRRSLACLEEGEFDALPADVFVRGFLRSYARCVGIDPEDTVARYRDVGRPEVPEAREPSGADSSRSATSRGSRSSRSSTADDAPDRDDVLAARADEDIDHDESAVGDSANETGLDNGRSWSHATGAFIARSLFEREPDEEASRRGTVTLAVIILVILATLTTSYWLRRPSSSGSGVTDAGEFVRSPARARA